MPVLTRICRGNGGGDEARRMRRACGSYAWTRAGVRGYVVSVLEVDVTTAKSMSEPAGTEGEELRERAVSAQLGLWSHA